MKMITEIKDMIDKINHNIKANKIVKNSVRLVLKSSRAGGGSND